MSIKKFLKISLAALMVLSLVACGGPKNDNVEFKEAGTFDKEETIASAEITADDVILQNKTIDGDLYINVPGNGSVTLSNVIVKGSIYVNMEKKVAYDFLEKVNAAGNQYTINLFDVVCNNVEIENFPTRLVASGSTNINMVKTNSDITLQEQNITKNGFNDVEITNGSKVEVTLLATGIRQLSVSNSANVELLTDTATLIEMLTADSPVNIYGGATINLLKANSDVTADNEPQSVVVGENGSFNGTKEPEETTTVTTTTPKQTTTTKKPVTTKPVTTTKKPVTTTTTTTQYIPPVTTTTTTTKPNTAPVITADDVTIMIDTAFNPLKGVTIYDAEDGNITVTSSHIKSNNVDTSRRGTYTVTYIYVDKGGLSTTLSRKVTVDNQLDAPENVQVGLNKYGEVEVTWDEVDGASSYSIFIGNTEIGYSSKPRFIIDSSEYRDGRDFTVGVRAVHRYDDIRPSDMAKATFEYEDGSDDFPRTVTPSKTAQEINYRISPVGVPLDRVYAEVRFYCDGSVVGSEYITKNDRTDNRGYAEIEYDRDEGINFEIVFDQRCLYEMSIKVTDGTEVFATDKFEIDASRGSSSGSTSGYTKPELISWEAGDTWSEGAELIFSLTNDFDIEDGSSSIEVIFYWAVKPWSEDIIVDYGKETEREETVWHGADVDKEGNVEAWEGEIYRIDSKVLGGNSVDAGEEISVELNSRSNGVNDISEAYYDDCEIYIYAEVIVTDSEGEERALRTKNIIIEK